MALLHLVVNLTAGNLLSNKDLNFRTYLSIAKQENEGKYVHVTEIGAPNLLHFLNVEILPLFGEGRSMVLVNELEERKQASMMMV